MPKFDLPTPDPDDTKFFGVYLGIPFVVMIYIIIKYALPYMLAGMK